MDNFDVSVIVPVFNTSEYICDTLDSIINQNFNNFEIIVVDDGSTDNCLDLIKNKLRNCKIPNKIIHQKNQGVSSARNVGIENSTGRYLVFVDGDDYISPNHLSQLYNPEYDFSLIQLTRDGEDSQHKYYQDEISTEEFIKMELLMQVPFNFVQLSYKSDIIKNNNIKFSTDYIYGEDLNFALKALIYGNNIKISNQTTYHYIQRQQSAIRTSDFRRFDIVKILEDLKDFYKKHGHEDFADLITTSRIPRAIFGNMNYFFYNSYDFNEVMDEMKREDLFTKLSKFRGNKKFHLKIKLFLLNPKIYYKIWKKFKNSID